MTFEIVLLCCLFVPQEPKKATVEISLVTPFGERIRGTLMGEYSLRDRRNPSRVFTSNRPEFRDIPFGHYDLEAHAFSSGFGIGQRVVRVAQEKVWVVLALPIGELGPIDPPDLAGTVIGLRSGGTAWVKLVSLYTDFSVEARIERGGRFEIKKAPQWGGHLLIVLDGDRVCHLRPWEVTDFTLTISVELTKDSPCAR